ncbi:MAG: phosphoglycerate mutase, partial [Myxococcota bacterium]
MSDDLPHRLRLLSRLAKPADTTMLLWVYDGMAGLPHPGYGRTELERARTPHLDAFAARASCGLHEPCGPGVTVGSGQGHLALFGWRADRVHLPRGVLEVLGADHGYLNGHKVEDVYLEPGDVAVRCNFARLHVHDGQRVIADRRSNDVTDAECDRLCRELSAELALDHVESIVFPGRKHRFALVLRGEDLDARLSDADPQRSLRPPQRTRPLVDAPAAHRTSALVNQWLDEAEARLEGEDIADTVLARGIGRKPDVPSFQQLYGIRAAAIATYPMYRGIAKLFGMDVLAIADDSQAARLSALELARSTHDFVFFHIKATDALAHRRDFDGKVACFERWDDGLGRA